MLNESNNEPIGCIIYIYATSIIMIKYQQEVTKNGKILFIWLDITDGPSDNFLNDVNTFIH